MDKLSEFFELITHFVNKRSLIFYIPFILVVLFAQHGTELGATLVQAVAIMMIAISVGLTSRKILFPYIDLEDLVRSVDRGEDKMAKALIVVAMVCFMIAIIYITASWIGIGLSHAG